MRVERWASPVLSLVALTVSLAVAGFVLFGGNSGWRVAEAVDVREALGPLGHDGRTRVQFPVQSVDQSNYRNYMVSLAHNWQWDGEAGWHRPVADEPSVALTLESYFRGLAELNLDIGAPGALPNWRGGRAMGFAARHDGSYSTLSIGGVMFNADGAGVKLTGGMTPEPVVLITGGERAHQPAMEVRRADGSPSLRLTGGATPGLAVGVGGAHADGAADGVLSVVGPARSPLIRAQGVGRDAALLLSRPDDGRGAGVAMFADGRIEWSGDDGASVAALSPDREGLRLAGVTTTAGLRVGVGGSSLSAVQLRAIELAAVPVPAGGIREQRVRLPDLAAGSLIFVNGPPQPPGLAVAGARAVDGDEIAIVFVNLGGEARVPSAGPYFVLAVQGVGWNAAQ